MTGKGARASSDDLVGAIADLGLTSLLNENIPVDIAGIARTVGAVKVSEADIPVAGMLVPRNDKFEILVKRGLDIVRQRFSCAHELAHVLLDPEHGVAMRRPPVPAGNELERKCEAMAALLLMPDPTFSTFAHLDAPGIRTIAKLAQIFLTSIQATALRFVDVIEEPCVLIVSEVRDGKQGFNLRVLWSYQNTNRPDGKSLYFIPRNGTLQLATARNASQSGRIECDTEEIRLGGLKVRAYTESKRFGFRRYRYVLTLVLPDRKAERTSFQ